MDRRPNNSKCLAFFSEKVKNGKFFFIISSGGYYYFFLLVLMWLLLWQRCAESVSCPLYQLVCPESDGGGHNNKGNLLFDQKWPKPDQHNALLMWCPKKTAIRTNHPKTTKATLTQANDRTNRRTDGQFQKTY